MAKDMLFATLDPTMRAVRLLDATDVILSDTVGFISDLPTQLVAAFRATLEEVLGADLIVHVRDIAHPESEEQAADVMSILSDLGVDGEVELIEAWNKVDLLDAARRAEVDAAADRRDDVFAISAWKGQGLDPLLAAVADRLSPPRFQTELNLPFSAGRKRAWLYEQGVVEDEVQGDDGVRFVVNWTARQQKAFREL